MKVEVVDVKGERQHLHHEFGDAVVVVVAVAVGKTYTLRRL